MGLKNLIKNKNEIFTKKCYVLEDENIHFFFRWYEVIIRDFRIFKSILEKYENSSYKDELLSHICIRYPF
jgi:hypothetical protein